MQVGLDIGSTTIKIAVLDDAGKLLFAKYQRHYSQIAEKIQELLADHFYLEFLFFEPLNQNHHFEYRQKEPYQSFLLIVYLIIE